MKTLIRCLLAAAVAAAALGSAVAADLKVGLNVALSGPNSSLGIPYSKGMQAALAYKAARSAAARSSSILLDDGSDPTAAGRNASKLIEEDKVDVLMGSSGVPSSIAIAQVADGDARRR